MDIDTFSIEEPVINPGDTAAMLKLDTGVDGFNIVYIFLSFDTVSTEETNKSPVGIITFGYRE